tara:strand:+ start:1058 stop:1693 length:636 start_codon:yes stop_codon:yes gene_type:complete
MEKPSYYAILTADVRYDKTLKPLARLLYAEITALCNKEGYCWASNQYFADLYEVDKTTVSGWIGQLKTRGYLTVQLQYKEGSKQILNRYIKINGEGIDEIINTPLQKNVYPIDEKTKVNTTVNNTINNKVNKGTIPPPREWVSDYCRERSNTVDVDTFMDFYTMKGWVVGKSKMKDWKAAVRTWEKTGARNERHKSTNTAGSKWLNIEADF